MVRFQLPQLHSNFGLIVEQEDAGFACRKSRCDSEWVHSIHRTKQSCGPAARAALLQRDDRGFESLQDYFTLTQIRQSEERLGLNPSVCGFDPCSGYFTYTWLGRQLEDHFGSEPWMLWVRLPPELLNNTPSWSSGVLVCLSRRRSSVQIRSGVLKTRHGTPIRESDGFQKSVVVGSIPSRATKKNMRRLGIGEPKWL